MLTTKPIKGSKRLNQERLVTFLTVFLDLFLLDFFLPTFLATLFLATFFLAVFFLAVFFVGLDGGDIKRVRQRLKPHYSC